jgi:hypothetical protein
MTFCKAFEGQRVSQISRIRIWTKLILFLSYLRSTLKKSHLMLFIKMQNLVQNNAGQFCKSYYLSWKSRSLIFLVKVDFSIYQVINQLYKVANKWLKIGPSSQSFCPHFLLILFMNFGTKVIEEFSCTILHAI